jgi:hypothetical protein
MSGYEVPQNTLKLKFADPTFDGLEVVMLVVPLSILTETSQLAKADPEDISDDDLQRLERLVSSFSDSLVSWNLTRKGRKVPATRKGVDSIDMVFTLQLIDAWMQGLGVLMINQAQEDAETAKSLQVQLAQ